MDHVATKFLKDLDVAGKDVAQVCCNNACELLSIKNMGAARCVGFDGAQGFLDQGRELAVAAGQELELVCCDATAIPASYYGCFDIVYISVGVLGWMPDLAVFFTELENLLRPGGALLIYEHHPVLMMVKPGPTGEEIEWELSYFTTEPYVETGGLDYYGGSSYEAKPVTSFSHKLSDIIMAGVETGLSLSHFQEWPHHISRAWWNVEQSNLGLPMCYTMVLNKPKAG